MLETFCTESLFPEVNISCFPGDLGSIGFATSLQPQTIIDRAQLTNLAIGGNHNEPRLLQKEWVLGRVDSNTQDIENYFPVPIYTAEVLSHTLR